MGSTLLSTARYTDRFVRRWFSAHPSLKEESITDWLLYTFRRRVPHSFIYRDFNRYEESHLSGADWDWWFIFDSKLFPMRIQAKKISASASNNRRGFNQANGRQRRKLITTSKILGYYPAYLLYAESAERGEWRPKKKIKHSRYPHSIYFSSAKQIRDEYFRRPNNDRPMNADDLISESVPLEKLFDRRVEKVEFSEIFLHHFGQEEFQEFFRLYHAHSSDHVGELVNLIFHDIMDEELEGNYAESSLEGPKSKVVDNVGNEYSKRLIEEYKNEFPGSAGIVIIKF